MYLNHKSKILKKYLYKICMITTIRETIMKAEIAIIAKKKQ